MLPPLREYQQAAVRTVFAERGHVCLVAPTGSGKTRMGVEILSQIQDRAVWVVHRRELLQQAHDVLDTAGLLGRVQPITVQSSERPPATTVLFDECHHYVSDDWSAMRDTYADAWRVGLTATPERSDGRALGDLFDRLVVAAKYSDLIRDGYLVPCRVLRPESGLDRGLAVDPLDAYRRHAADRSGFVFVPRIEEARKLAERFTAAGIPAEAVDAGTPTEQRDAAIQGLRSGAVRLLVSVHALTEGVDVPAASVCLLARNFGHVSPYLQAAGRVLRSSPGKSDALLIDLPGVSHVHGIPTEDRLYSLDGVGIRRAAESVTTCMMCGASYETGPVKCPACGFQKPTDDWQPLRIYDVALSEVYLGAATADDAKQREYLRLRGLQKQKGWSVEWVVKHYKRLFGSAPCLDDVTTEERTREYQRWADIAESRGYKWGYAAARYRAVFGESPSERIFKRFFRAPKQLLRESPEIEAARTLVAGGVIRTGMTVAQAIDHVRKYLGGKSYASRLRGDDLEYLTLDKTDAATLAIEHLRNRAWVAYYPQSPQSQIRVNPGAVPHIPGLNP